MLGKILFKAVLAVEIAIFAFFLICIGAYLAFGIH